MVVAFEDRSSENFSVSGIRDVWTAVQQGKAITLLVEKDFLVRGYLTADESRIYLKPPAKPYKEVVDAVYDIIETIIKKKEKVYFVENGALDQHGQIGLITHYQYYNKKRRVLSLSLAFFVTNL